jgi:hypothetical protein
VVRRRGGGAGRGGKTKKRDKGHAYGVVVAETDVAVHVYAALAGFENGGDERAGVEGGRDDVDAFFSVA